MYIVNNTNVTMNEVADQSIRYCGIAMLVLLTLVVIEETMT